MDTKGGRYTLTISGVTYSGRAKATIKPARVSRTNAANMDGTGYSTVKPELAEIDLTFDRGSGVVWNEALILSTLNVTFIEDDAGVTHLLTNAAFDGTPAIDTENGEVSGLKLCSDKYQTI